MVCSLKKFFGETNMAFLMQKPLDKQLLRAFLIKHIGLPYLWGGDDPIDGYDCSGFSVETLQAFGRFPHKHDTTAQGLYDLFASSPTLPKLGALAFYGKDNDHVTHVGICLNNWQIIEAGGGGRTTTDERKAALQNAYIRIRPLKYRSDHLVCLDPFVDGKVD